MEFSTGHVDRLTRAWRGGLALLASIFVAASGRSAPVEAQREILVLTLGEALEGSDVALPEGGARLSLRGVAADGGAREIPAQELMLLRFRGPRSDRPPAAWLCLRDGRRFRGAALRLAPDAVRLVSGAGEEIASASPRDIAALLFHASDPAHIAPPAAGVRLLSIEGEPLEAPSVRLGEEAVMVDIDPSLDPVRLPLERLSGLVWAEEPVGVGAGERPSGDQVVVEFRSGERRRGALVSIGKESLVLRDENGARALQRRDVESLWFGAHRGTLLDGAAPRPPPGPDRPPWRVGRDALGGPLRIGSAAYETGLGLRAPASIEIPVPARARWLIARAGASADAAPFARVTIDVLVGGIAAASVAERRPGSPAIDIVLPVRGASAVTVRASAAEPDATGCIGALVDAMFVE